MSVDTNGLQNYWPIFIGLSPKHPHLKVKSPKPRHLHIRLTPDE
jgi:hypothetical protein